MQEVGQQEQPALAWELALAWAQPTAIANERCVRVPHLLLHAPIIKTRHGVLVALHVQLHTVVGGSQQKVEEKS